MDIAYDPGGASKSLLFVLSGSFIERLQWRPSGGGEGWDFFYCGIDTNSLSLCVSCCRWHRLRASETRCTPTNNRRIIAHKCSTPMSPSYIPFLLTSLEHLVFFH